MGTEELTLSFTEGAVNDIARLAYEVNDKVENIGARRLHTVMEKLLEDVSFTASDKSGQSFEVTEEFVKTQLNELAQNTDLSKFIL